MEDHPHKMSEDEAKCREALAAGKVDEATVHALLHQAAMLGSVREGIALLWSTMHRGLDVVAENDTKGVAFVRYSVASGKWQATWQCGRSKSVSHRDTKEEALRWAAEQPAGVRLFLNPETNDWEAFVATAVLHGHYAIDPDNYF